MGSSVLRAFPMTVVQKSTSYDSCSAWDPPGILTDKFIHRKPLFQASDWILASWAGLSGGNQLSTVPSHGSWSW
jgi:hypothetical protein